MTDPTNLIDANGEYQAATSHLIDLFAAIAEYQASTNLRRQQQVSARCLDSSSLIASRSHRSLPWTVVARQSSPVAFDSPSWLPWKVVALLPLIAMIIANILDDLQINLCNAMQRVFYVHGIR